MRLLARFSKANLALAGAAACLFLMSPAQASEPPLSGKKVRISVPTGRPLAEFLTELFGQAGLRVKVSSTVTGTIGGTFSEAANKLWEQTARSKNLVAFYDGSVVRVYSASEITSRNFTTASPDNVLKEARRQNLISTGNSIKSGSGSVTASGVPAFLDRISQIAANAKAPPVKTARAPKAEPAMVPVTPSSPPIGAVNVAANDIVSPINSNPALASRVPNNNAALASIGGATDFKTLSKPTQRDPYEIRLYRLKYADASDREFNLGDSVEIQPGVATLLNQLMGYNAGTYAPVSQTSTQQSGGSSVIDAPPLGGAGYGSGGPYYQQPQIVVQKVEEIENYTGPRIVADKSRNTVMIKDLPSQMVTYDSFIRSVDIPHTQLQIDVVIVDLDRDRTRTLGIDWEFGFNALRGLFGGQVRTSVGEQGNANASFVQNNGTRVSARISALSENGYLKVVKQQQIFVRANEVGTMDNRETIVVPFGGQYNGGYGRELVGTFLSVVPQVTIEEDQILTTLRMDIRDGSVGNNLSRLKNTRVNTTATVPQGESIILGGVTIESEFESNSKVPIAGDIPIAGNLFRRKTKGGRRIERVIILTPRVMSNEPIAPSRTPAAVSDGVPIPAKSGKEKKSKKDKKAATISLLMGEEAAN